MAKTGNAAAVSGEQKIDSMNKNLLSVCVMTGAAYFVSVLSLWIQPHFYLLICAMLSFIALLLELGKAVLFINRDRYAHRPQLIAACLCPLFLGTAFICPSLGRSIKDGLFRRHKSEYMGIVEQIANGQVLCETNCTGQYGNAKPPRQPRNVMTVMVKHCQLGGTNVAFVFRVGVPLVHEGYVLEDPKIKNACTTDVGNPHLGWHYFRYIGDNWYHFSDQPGL